MLRTGRPIRSQRKRILTLVSLAAVPIFVFSLHPVDAQNAWRLEPGQGYGPIYLGVSPEEVTGRLGSPRGNFL